MPSLSTTSPSESRAAPVSSSRGTTLVGLRVRRSRVKRAERSERAARSPFRSTASAEKLPTNVPSYVVLSRASEKRSSETAGEQALPVRALAFTGPAAVRQVAAARVAVTAASRVREDRGLRGLRGLRGVRGVRRRMAVTVGRVGDGREALR
ncbi:hypothetical protein QFZ49_000528 [Streptomyces turgidiscabies]|uniref:Uncharacterized protein n=1 Tax=Streptomyces turgidiscabies TaxID=85558 RepID=A0ABU0RF59_9ACTN|nr:hypothetical protein [Streptomyces turgidiscabies]